ncbi:MAG: helix-turn-helix transcriptional regulator [Thaumarchaeota archaeon]|nr:helix-turn-helix transcriptional regulator [Nitrososphaerota archaeon]
MGTKSDTNEDVILRTLLDVHCRAILGVTTGNPTSASAISLACNMPLSTVYRRLKILRTLKFLHVSCTIRPDGKKLLLFQNRLVGIDISWNDAKLQISTNFSGAT